MNMIELKGVTKRFDGFAALSALDLTVPQGAVYGLIGPNGAGKTTAIRHITGMLRPDEGQVLLSGEPVFENPPVKERLFCIADGRTGYIRGDLVDITLFPAPPGAVQPVGLASVDADGAALMDGPSSYCNELANVPAGTECEVWHTIGSWYHIRVNGSFGFMRRSDVEIRLMSEIDLHMPDSEIIVPGIRPRP